MTAEQALYIFLVVVTYGTGMALTAIVGVTFFRINERSPWWCTIWFVMPWMWFWVERRMREAAIARGARARPDIDF